jgi:hypothetical protein
MKYICLGYLAEEKFFDIEESERNRMLDECFAYDDELRAAGHFTDGFALQSVQNTATLKWGRTGVSVTDGPFVETKEHLGGIIVLEARDLNHAIQLMSKHPSLPMGSTWEIRPTADLQEMLNASEQRRRAVGA